jgi:nitroreductase
VSTAITVEAREAFRHAVGVAVRAPSEHNAQPWRWVLSSVGLDLYVEPSRRLRFTDQSGHGVLLACGCALHHLRVALSDLGWDADVRHQADESGARPLARVRLRGPRPPDPRSRRLLAAIEARRTDRRRFSDRPVDREVMSDLADAARPYGGVLHEAFGSHRAVVVEAMREAAERQRDAEGYAAELDQWTHRYAGGHDGIPASARLDSPPPTYRDLTLRWFPRGTLRQTRGGAYHRDASTLAVLSAVDDHPVSVLRAGEALSAVLLEATAHGVGTTPITQVLEVPETYDRLRQQVVGVHRRPVVLLRLGWPPEPSEPLRSTPRRPIEEVLTEVV